MAVLGITDPEHELKTSDPSYWVHGICIDEDLNRTEYVLYFDTDEDGMMSSDILVRFYASRMEVDGIKSTLIPDRRGISVSRQPMFQLKELHGGPEWESGPFDLDEEMWLREGEIRDKNTGEFYQ